MTNLQSNNKSQKFDLEDRTKSFAKEVIKYCRSFENQRDPLINQLLRTGTSIGANYMEANECVSKKDFQHKIVICKREAKETMYWIELISDECENKDLSRSLWKEAHELLLIFAAIIRK